MNIQLLSDLHLEADPNFVATPAPGADVLVLAGDIGSYQAGSLLQDPDFGLTRFAPKHGWPVPVLMVAGNHEYDGMDFDTAHARLQESCERLGIVLLERQTITWSELTGQSHTHDTVEVRFVGTTLWSDFDSLNPPLPPGGSLTTLLKARDKAFRAANYYLRKTGGTRYGQPMLAAEIRAQSLLCQQWLRDALAEPFKGTTVVITHFAPSLQSADPRYGLSPGTAGFCNALDDLLPQASLWLHGHLHASSDYVKAGCRVVSNPLGYARKGEQLTFKPGLCIEAKAAARP